MQLFFYEENAQLTRLEGVCLRGDKGKKVLHPNPAKFNAQHNVIIAILNRLRCTFLWWENYTTVKVVKATGDHRAFGECD